MKFVRLTDTGSDMYAKALSLYKLSFPYPEQREEKPQMAIMAHPEYFFNLIYDNDSFVGIMLNWETEDFSYIEHFCILPEMRNRHYGERTLQHLKSINGSKKIILEIEPPVDELTLRRRGFYERSGFKVNSYRHIQPTYHKGEDGLMLTIMSYPEKLSDTEYESFYSYMKTVIFGEY